MMLERILIMKTKVTELLNIQYPIILGGLQWLGMAELAAAVSEAGGFGLITAGTFQNKAELLDEIAKARKLTSKPLGVNITLGRRRSMNEFFEGVIEAGVSAVFTSGNNPGDFVKEVKKAGIKLIHVVPSIRFALKAEAFGADAVVIVGYEAGGHPGMDEVTLMSLIPRAVRALKIPVIAAGAIADGNAMAAALALGAEGVQIGTRFVATKESIAHPAVKEAILSAKEDDTVITLRSLKDAYRVLNTNAAQRLLEMERNSASSDDLLSLMGREVSYKVMREGQIEQGVLTVGQGIGVVNEILSAREVVHRLVQEAEERLHKVSAMMT